MIELTRSNKLGIALAGLAIVLFVLPAIFPVQPMLTHDTRYSVPMGEDRLTEEGFEIIAYENLTDRGQELYVRTLQEGGEYRVAMGEGAADFAYPTDAERRRAYEAGRDGRIGRIVIERPADDSALPDADERSYGKPEEVENETQHEKRVSSFDAMRTGVEQPPLGSTPQLLRLVAAILAVISLGTGGYLLSLP